MGEIITIQLGQCGAQLGTQFWETICQQHGLEPGGFYCGQHNVQLERAGVYFHELRSARYIPRSVLVDLEPGVLDTIQTGVVGRMIPPTNFLRGQNGGGNNWGTGFYTDGAELAPNILDVIRREAERSDSLQGFNLVHGVPAGTGGGLGSLLLSSLYDEYPHQQRMSFSVFPRSNYDIVVYPYNITLSMKYLSEYCDVAVCMDSERAATIVQSQTYPAINRLLASTMAGLTLPFRFPSQINSDLRKLVGNMVPFPRLHFFQTGFAPLDPPDLELSQIETIFQKENRLLLDYGADDHIPSLAATFQGDVLPTEAHDAVQAIRRQHGDSFVEWIPDNAQAVLCQDIPAPRSVTSLTHSASIRGMMGHFLERHNVMYKMKAFMMYYFREGMDELEFKEASEYAEDLVAEYSKVVDGSGVA
ncbi:Tubulin/FtsZ, GTPase domain-containing protein [Flagelloscypha sp. PMI_526]|nr:Tubulin/FtsZ, GTPase domain-containing protein [Flagelloscypha sp. PMI_526]